MVFDITSLNCLIYYSRAWNFVFMKLDFNTIYYEYSNKSPFKYYVSILWGVGGLRPCLFCLFGGRWVVQNLGKLAYIILARYLKYTWNSSVNIISSISLFPFCSSNQFGEEISLFLSEGRQIYFLDIESLIHRDQESLSKRRLSWGSTPWDYILKQLGTTCIFIYLNISIAPYFIICILYDPRL